MVFFQSSLVQDFHHQQVATHWMFLFFCECMNIPGDLQSLIDHLPSSALYWHFYGNKHVSKRTFIHPKILDVPWWSREYNFFTFFPQSQGAFPIPWLPWQSDRFLSWCLLNPHFRKKYHSHSHWLIFFLMFMKILSPYFVPSLHQNEQAFIFWADAPMGAKSSFWNDYCLIANLYLTLWLSVSLPLWIICERIGGKLLQGLWKYLSSRLPAVHPALLSSKTLTHTLR